MISDHARKIFDALPSDNSKIGNGKARDRIFLSQFDYDRAKKELKAAGLVELGKGRGGSIGRVEGAVLPEVEEKKTPEEALEIAREVKKEKTRLQKENDAMREHVIKVGKRKHPDATEIIPGRYGDSYYYEAWEGTKGAAKASIHFLEDEELL